MLLRFSVENFMSFRSREELSMIPSRVRRHTQHVVSAQNTSDIPALKTAVIYGANASGKSNLAKAIRHALNLILNGPRAGKKIPYNPFRLDSALTSQPSRFEFEIKTAGRCYAYGFVASEEKISEEWLFEIGKSSEKVIFSRQGDRYDFSGIKFREKSHSQFLEFTSKGTPENRLFLSECRERNVIKQIDYINAVFDVLDWFENKLRVIFPNSKYAGLLVNIRDSEDAAEMFSKILRSFDTGISKLTLKEMDVSSIPEIPQELLHEAIESLESDKDILIAGGPENMRYQLFKDESGAVKAYKLMTSHTNEKQEEVQFDINQESDGTQRLLDLSPGLVDIFSKEMVYVIDELDRSLHTEITKAIIAAFLHKTSKINSQLIVTTHDTNLLDQDILRKDEIWFTQKEKYGESKLYSLEEFQTRFDKDIRKGYLLGRYGGVPRLPCYDNLFWMGENA